MVPESWATLRLQWEWSHAAGAILDLAAVALLIASLLGQPAPGSPGSRH